MLKPTVRAAALVASGLFGSRVRTLATLVVATVLIDEFVLHPDEAHAFVALLAAFVIDLLRVLARRLRHWSRH